MALAVATALAMALAIGAAGCGRGGGLPACGEALQSCCSGSCATGLFCEDGVCTGGVRSPVELRYRTKVDLLFLVDDSPSMEPMSIELRKRFSQFFQVFKELAQSSFYADLHLGVVTSDLGAGATGAPQCDRGGGGRGGRFQAVGKAAAPTCVRPLGADFVQYVFAASGDGPNNLPQGQDLLGTFTCMASVGATGCGFEHVLEAARAALSAPPPGFLRDDALLAVVFVTNEDDCSAPFDTDLFDEGKVPQYGFLDSYRCSRFGVVHGSPPALLPYADSGGPLVMAASAPNPGGGGPGKLWDLSRYLDLFTKPAAQGGVKADPDDITLVGIDAAAAPASVILSNPGTAAGVPYAPCARLDEKTSPPCVPVLQHSCVNPGNAAFFGDPAIRLNAVIAAAPHHATSSICDNDYSAALHDLGSQIAAQLGLGCIGSALPQDPANPGQVLADCTVTDVTQAGGMTSTFNIPRCATPPTTYPCWRVETKAACAKQSPQGLGITIDRNGAPTPPGANIKASCATVGH